MQTTPVWTVLRLLWYPLTFFPFLFSHCVACYNILLLIFGSDILDLPRLYLYPLLFYAVSYHHVPLPSTYSLDVPPKAM